MLRNLKCLSVVSGSMGCIAICLCLLKGYLFSRNAEAYEHWISGVGKFYYNNSYINFVEAPTNEGYIKFDPAVISSESVYEVLTGEALRSDGGYDVYLINLAKESYDRIMRHLRTQVIENHAGGPQLPSFPPLMWAKQKAFWSHQSIYVYWSPYESGYFMGSDYDMFLEWIRAVYNSA